MSYRIRHIKVVKLIHKIDVLFYNTKLFSFFMKQIIDVTIYSYIINF